MSSDLTETDWLALRSLVEKHPTAVMSFVTPALLAHTLTLLLRVASADGVPRGLALDAEALYEAFTR